ncbi:hypothetical protein BaRGS_00031844 [Batillaria attramentaria]|uniref:tRNA(Phe) (4-demethylwyosine(37)-C(7)) aminocarboxypropyltransferase n=1 Tax=Batillaria attramentaria TaxID=370345 RepID=A0ABD0JQA6_9CAEN
MAVSICEELWLTVAKCLCGKRVARQAVVKTDGFRSPQVRLLLGDSGTVQHLDNGIRYEYDVTRCMFSAGNITEKLRIAGFKCQGETVVDLYAGIGYFTLPYLVHGGADYVHACEWNPDAVAALTHNLRLNRVEHRCTVHPGDNQKLPLVGIADRVNLGLIPSSQVGWPVACRVLKAKGGVLHVHGNVNSRTGVGEALKACQTQGDSEDIFKCSEDSLRASACVTSYMQSDSEDRDVGGQDKIRPLWRHYYTGTQGLIFVVDCADRDRIDEARQELHRIINDREMRDAIILVFANKQDLPDAMKPHEIQEKLGLTRIRDRNWYVQPSCATTGDGLFEGLTWLTSNHKS